MAVALEARIWYDDRLPVNDRFLLAARAVATWEPLLGDWKRLNVVDRFPGARVFRVEQELSLQDIEKSLGDYSAATLKVSVDVGLRCWRYFDDSPQRGFLRMWVESIGESYGVMPGARGESYVSLAVTHSAPYHAYLNVDPGDEERALERNRAVEENLDAFVNLLRSVIEATNPRTLKVFEDTVKDYDAVNANLIYYRDLSDAVAEMQALHKQGKLDSRALGVTRDTVQLVLVAGDYLALPVLSGVMILSRRHFMNARIADFFRAILGVADNSIEIRAGYQEVVDAIATFQPLLSDAQGKAHSRDLLVALPIFERHRSEALRQLGVVLRDGSSGVQWMAASALRMLGDAQAAAVLASALGVMPMEKEVRIHVIRELCRMAGNAQTRDALLCMLQDRDREIRSEAVSALTVVDPQALLANIEVVFNDADALVHSIGIGFLEKLGNADLVVDLIERCPGARVRLILLLARLRDPRAVDLLLKIVTQTIPSEASTYEAAIACLADWEDPRTLPAMIALLGKTGTRESDERVRLLLLSLQTQVGDGERALIRAAIAGYEDQWKKSWLSVFASAPEPASAFTLETYRAFVAEVKDVRSSVYWAGIARDFEREEAGARKLRFELPAMYWARLPVALLARCPICGGRVTERLDTFSLSGVGWWYNEPGGLGWFGPKPRSGRDAARLMDPSYVAECEHVQALHYGVNLNGIIPNDVEAVGDVVIGSERPGVWWPFLEQEGNCAVIHALPVGRLDDDPWRPRYTAYFVTYFGQDSAAFQRSLLPWPWYAPNFLWPYDLADYDLAPWVSAGKLHWLGEEADGFPLRQGVEGFPYANIAGLEGRWAVDTEKGAKLLPPVKGVAPYMQGYPSLSDLEAKEKAALQARGFRLISRE